MPGPTRSSENNAARQRAYRRRKQAETDALLEEAEDTNMWAYLVQGAVEAARRGGDPLAQQVYRTDALETLRAVADHFYDRAETPPRQRPWGSREAVTPSEGLPAAPDSQPGGKHLR
jgi:hypothetical protein